MKRSKLKFNSFLSIFVCYSVVFISPVYSQTPVPTIDEVEKHRQLIISEEAKLIAEEYADILRELQELTLDYSRTFSRFNDESSILSLKELNSLIHKLANGEYLADIDLLSDDLSDVRARLRKQGKEALEKAKYLENNKRKEAIKAYKLSRSLDRDLESFDVILMEDINFKLQNLKKLTNEIQICLNQISQKDLDRYSESITKYITIIGDSISNLYSFSINSDSHYIYIPDVPNVAGVVVDVSPAPVPPTDIKSYSYVYQQKSGQAIATKEFSDSLEVKSSRVPIHINNPTGNLIITGWNKKFVFVTSILEVISAAENDARDVTDNTVLNFISEDSGIYVAIDIPKIKNSYTSINNCQFEIKVPRDNPIIGKSSFGAVSLINLENSINFETVKSDVQVKSVIGDVKITNNGKPINIEEVEGLIEVKNNFSPIVISQCIGKIKAQNTFAAVKVFECEGDIEINNSGLINLFDNEGNITITNTKGFIDIRNHDGDITAKNSFEPLILDAIYGAVNVSNMRGIIKAQHINGPFKAVNEFAPIFAYYNEGTFDFNNTRGMIDVILTDSYNGASSIHSQFGDIKLALDEDLDIVLNARMEMGKIISDFPINIKSTGNTEEGKYILGNGGATLTVIGTNSTLVLSNTR